MREILFNVIKSEFPTNPGGNSIDKKIITKIVMKNITKIITKNLSKSYNKKFMKSVVGTCLLFKLEFREDFREDFRDDFLSIELPPRSGEISGRAPGPEISGAISWPSAITKPLASYYFIKPSALMPVP